MHLLVLAVTDFQAGLELKKKRIILTLFNRLVAIDVIEVLVNA